MVFIHKEKYYKSLVVLPPIRKKEHFLTYFSNVLREIHKQRKELNTLCKLHKTASTSLHQLQVKTQPGSEFRFAHHVFLRVPIEVPCWSFVIFRAAQQFRTCTGHQLWSWQEQLKANQYVVLHSTDSWREYSKLSYLAKGGSGLGEQSSCVLY